MILCSRGFSLETGLFCTKGEFLHMREPEKAATNLSSLFYSLHGSQVQTTLWRCPAVRNLKIEHNNDNWHYPIDIGGSCPLKMQQKLGQTLGILVSQKFAGVGNTSVSISHILRQAPVLMSHYVLESPLNLSLISKSLLRANEPFIHWMYSVRLFPNSNRRLLHTPHTRLTHVHMCIHCPAVKAPVFLFTFLPLRVIRWPRHSPKGKSRSKSIKAISSSFFD